MAAEGFLFTKAHWLVRAVAFVTALLLIDSTLLTDVIGLGLAAAIILLQHFKRKREQHTAAAA
ncbi:hypothetical protein MR810_08225 [bacterium]|nr:hypothetical protein [bacterium]